MKQHGLKILMGICILILAGTIWLCVSTTQRVQTLSYAVKTQANVLKEYLGDQSSVAEIETDFHSGQILSRIRSNWSRSPEVPERTFPPSVLAPPSGSSN